MSGLRLLLAKLCDRAHVFQPAIYNCLKCNRLKHSWDLQRTGDQLILVSSYYITMKSTLFQSLKMGTFENQRGSLQMEVPE